MANKILVAVFSATGTTKGVAEKIAAITGADIYEIKAAQEYTSDDLNYNDPNSRTSMEQDDSDFRTEIGSDPVSLDGYTTVYIGYPIWWGEEPRIMDTFVESYNFDGITMIPFCTSGSSGIGRSGEHLKTNAGTGNWLDGQRFSGSTTEDELREWIVARREGTVGTQLGTVVLGDIDVAKTHGHDVDTDDASLKEADAKTEGVDGGATGETTLATIEDGVGVSHFDVVDKGQTGDVAEHSVETTHIRDIDSSPASAASPGVDEQFGGTGGTATFIIACLNRRDGKRREKHNYSKYS